jgi:hypothetical protein
MSQAVEKTKPIGPVQIYWGDVRLGSPKSTFVVRHNTETVQSKQEDSGLNVGSHKTGETMEVDVILDNFKIHELRYVYAAANQFASTPVINSIAYDASTSTVMRFNELHQLNSEDNITLDQASFMTGTIMVWKSDFSNTPDGYVRSTDYTADSSAGTVARIDGGDISDGDTVYIEYNETATVERMGFGGELADFEATFRAVNKTADGKQIQFFAFRAKKIGASDIAIAMADMFAGVPMTFHILADLAQPVPKQLGHWTVEA